MLTLHIVKTLNPCPVLSPCWLIRFTQTSAKESTITPWYTAFVPFTQNVEVINVQLSRPE